MKPIKRRAMKSRCVQCGVTRSRPIRRGDDSGRFCSVGCAVDYALERGWDDTWCGRLYDDNPNSDNTGPHGWYDTRDYPDGCPECADEEE